MTKTNNLEYKNILQYDEDIKDIKETLGKLSGQVQILSASVLDQLIETNASQTQDALMLSVEAQKELATLLNTIRKINFIAKGSKNDKLITD